MSDFPYYKWYPSDFRSSTSHFSLTERAVYRELLDWSWLNGPLPENERRLASICGCSLRRFRAAWRTVQVKFEQNGSGLVNQRLERIRLETLEISDKRAEAGRIGGLAKAKQMPKQLPSKRDSKRLAKPWQSDPDPEPEKKGELPTPSAPPAADAAERRDEVGEVWEFYCRRRDAYYQSKNGRKPPPLHLTKPRRALIRRAIIEHDYETARYAGGGIFMHEFFTGKNDRDREYLTPEIVWRCGQRVDHVDEFAALYREALAAEGL